MMGCIVVYTAAAVVEKGLGSLLCMGNVFLGVLVGGVINLSRVLVLVIDLNSIH